MNLCTIKYINDRTYVRYTSAVLIENQYDVFDTINMKNTRHLIYLHLYYIIIGMSSYNESNGIKEHHTLFT